MLRNIILGGIAAFALAACSGTPEVENSADVDATVQTAPTAPALPDKNQPRTEAQIQQELKVFQDSVEQAMNDIPPELREKFQTAFACEIEKNNKAPQPKEIDATTIREITARLKAGGPAAC